MLPWTYQNFVPFQPWNYWGLNWEMMATTFHTGTAGDGDGWCQNLPVWSAPRRRYACGRIFSRSLPYREASCHCGWGWTLYLLELRGKWHRKLLTERRKLSGVWICRPADLTKSEWDILFISQRYYVCRIVITSLHSCILAKRSQDCRSRSISLRLPKSVPLGLWRTKRDYANVSYRSKVVSASSVLGSVLPGW
jgi:hypothetical protein